MFKMMMVLASILLSGSVWASGMPANLPLVIGLSAGPTWISGNKTQTISLEPDVIKTYTATNLSSAVPSVELFVGVQQSWFTSLIKQPLIGQLGASIVDAGNVEQGGDIWDEADPAFNNANYTYKVNHAHLAIKGRLICDGSQMFKPYISASIGVGFNHAYDFSTYPTNTAEVVPPSFASNTTTTFTYTLGIGLQTSFTTQLQAAIGYEFADWGQIQLSRAAGQTTNQGLALNHLYANQLQLSLFYTV